MRILLNKIQILVIFCLILTQNIHSQAFTELISLPSGVSNGSVAWGDYDNDGYLDILAAGSGIAKVYKNSGASTFSEQTGITSTLAQVSYACAAWGDYNNDGYLDILLAGDASGAFTGLYKNNKDNTFSIVNGNSFEPVYNASVAWCDYDNDGDLDFALTGMNSSGSRISKIYKNLGLDKFEEQYAISLIGINAGSVTWADYDNDGWQDLLLLGSNYLRLYHNNGDNTFSAGVLPTFEGFNSGNASWCDFNNDGRPDFFASGLQSGVKSYLYQKNTDDSFTKQTGISLTGVYYSSSAWGDYNNDGISDLLISGTTNGTAAGAVSILYENDGIDKFTEISSGLSGLIYSSVAWGDYDNDGYLDILLAGNNGISDVIKVYRNNTSATNSVPSAPTSPTQTVSGSNVTLNWTGASDDHTPAASITYNVMLGTSSGAINIISPQASTTNGFRRVPAMGNGQLGTNLLLRNLKSGNYYWKVQAIDNSHKGGLFSNQGTFTISGTSLAVNVTSNKTSSFSSLIQWVRGTGTQCAVFMKEGNSGTASPVNGTAYTASSVFGTGTQISSSGWFCIYLGTGSSVSVTNLKYNTSYMVHVCEMTAATTYLSSTATGNPGKFTTDFFTEQTSHNFPGSFQKNVAWGDYNNDGFLDFITGNSSNSTIYKNNGNNTFTAQSSILIAGTLHGMAAWGDYNNDGYLDLATIGSGFTKIYKNNGNNTFTDQVSTFPSVMGNGAVEWADFDNDGDLDLLFAGASGSQKVAKVFRNNGNGSFTEQPGISLPGFQAGAVKIADYDNDGFKDICIGGELQAGYTSQIFRNEGDFNFTFQSQINLGGIYSGSAAWGDYNNDGFIDLFLTGMYSYSSLYKNNGNNSFDLVSTPEITSMYGSSDVAWADFDNDGDLDLFLSGYTSGFEGSITEVYQNNGPGAFDKLASIHLPGCSGGSMALADYDNDHDLDLLIQGSDDDNLPYTKIFRNDLSMPDNVPPVPGGMTETIERKGITFSWNPVTGYVTSAKALTYNLRVSRTSGKDEIISSHSATSGYRKVSNTGNMGNNTTFLLKNLLPGSYFWSVQTIDNNFEGGSFGTERPFTVPELQAQNLTASIKDNKSLLIRWERGNGERCVVFCKQGVDAGAAPINNTTYIADNRLGYGNQIGSTGWYCIYNGRADSVILNGLASNISYSVHVIEYTGNPGSEDYFNSTSSTNPGIFETTIISEQTSISFTKTVFGAAEFADYNNDNFLDILVTGSIGGGGTTQLWKNNGNNTFTEQNAISMTGILHSDVAWGDYDKDGYLDLLIAGATNYNSPYNPVAKIYHNDGGTGFTVAPVTIAAVSFPSVSWGDYNNDSYIDFVIAGATGTSSAYNPVTKIYKNNGNGTFSELSVSLPGIYKGTTDWGDFDNDGDLDLMIIGINSANNETRKIFENKGGDTFTDAVTLSAFNYSPSSSIWADYNKDGFMDIILAGNSIQFYKNNGDKTFSRQTAMSIPGMFYPKIKSVDINNDGRPDLVCSADYSGSTLTKVYINSGNNSFSLYPDLSLTGASQASLTCGDYDNDGDIDFFVAGFSSGGYYTSMFRNNTIMSAGNPSPNVKPVAPTGLSYQSVPGGVTLKWEPVKSNESNFKNLSYNIKVINTDNNAVIIPPHTLASETRTIVKMGNCQLDTAFMLKLPQGNYKWSVQAIDQIYAGGAWSAEQSFNVKSVQAFFAANEVCQGLPTQFTDQSVATNGISSWFWEFGDGTTSTLQNPQHIYALSGAYSVKLTITDTQTFSDFLIQIVNVKVKPSTNFTANTVCQGTSTAFTNSTNNNGLTISSWSWDFGDGETAIVQNPGTHPYLGAADYNVTLMAQASNGCVDEISKSISVVSYPVAAVSADGPTTFCSGQSVTLSTLSNSNYTYQWKRDGANITGASSNNYLAQVSGSYTASVTNKGLCTTLSSPAVNIVVNTAPSAPLIYAAGPITFCQGQSVDLSVTNNAGHSYQWKRDGGVVGTNSNLFNANTAGTYSLIVTNPANCSANSTNTVAVSVNPLPSLPAVNISGPTTFCQGNNVELSVTNTGGYTYQWENNGFAITGATTNTLVANSSGVYSLKITNSSNCFIRTENVTVIVLPAPSSPAISADGPVTFCQGDATILSVTNTAGYSYQWKLNGGAVGSNSNVYSANASGTYNLVVTNSSNCSVSSTNSIAITVNPNPAIPTVNISGPTAFCQGGNVELSVASTPGYEYQWENNGSGITGAVFNSYVAQNSGNYILKISNSYSCSTKTENVAVTVASAPSAPLITAASALTFCQGDSVDLSVTPGSDLAYQWKLNGGAIGTNTPAIKAKNAGSYSLTVSNSTGCSSNSTNNIAVAVNARPSIPTVNLSGPTTFCQGNSVELSVAATSGYNYQWENNGTAITGAASNALPVNNSGLYSLKITNADNCYIKTENVSVNVLSRPSAPTISSVGNTTFCQSDSVVLSVANTPGYSYQWRLNGGSVGTNSNQLVAKTSGSYDIVVSNSSGCSVSSVIPVAVVANPLPVMSIITVKGEEKFCSGESTNLSVPANKDYTFAWKKGTGDLGLSTNSIDVTESGSYTVELNLAGCKLTAEPVAIEVVAKPARPDIDPGAYSPPMCLGENPLRLSVDNIVPGYTYQWYKNETPVGTETFVDVVEAGNYYLEAVADICSSERSSLSVTFAPAPLKPVIIPAGPTVWYLSTTSKAESYKWYFNGNLIPGATGSSYMAGQNFGIYRLAVANENGCYSFSDTLRIPTFRTTGIEDSDPFADVKIYPNPTTGLFKIEMNNNFFGELVIDIITQNGSKILNIKFDKSTEHFMSQIDLSGQPNGMYLINLAIDKFKASRKVLVE